MLVSFHSAIYLIDAGVLVQILGRAGHGFLQSTVTMFQHCTDVMLEYLAQYLIKSGGAVN